MSKSRTSRRAFHRQLAALAVAPVLAGTAAAQAPTEAAPPTAAQALTALVRLRHGRHLSADQLRHVGEHVAANQRAADHLARIALANGDEPAFLFSADVP
jgi:hypothetical protein